MRLFKMLSVFALAAMAPTAFAATLSVSPASSNLKAGDTLTVSVLLDTQGTAVDGVDLYYLNYNPALLQVQDADSSASGIQVGNGSALSQTTANSVDASAGRITFSRIASGGQTYTGSGEIAVITFKAIANGTANLTFDHTPGKTTDSNIASNGADVLTGVTNGSYTITGGSTTPTPTPTPTPNGGSEQSHQDRCMINDRGTYYLLMNRQRIGIANPGLLFSHGYDFSEAVMANDADRALPAGELLKPGDGALVKKPGDATVFLTTGGQKHGFVSAEVFTALGYKFSTVLTVTAPELDAVPLGAIISDPTAAHPYGVHINQDGTVYWMGNGVKQGYPSMEVYNSWNIDNNFSHVVPANTADRAFPVGPVITPRTICR